MVCKECGAYNADDLVSCRVCGASLREEQPGRPQRSFVEAPSFAGKAYESETSDALRDAQRAAKERQEKLKAEAEAKKEAEQAPTRFCTACGKPLYADAPFCAFCGTRNALLGEEPVAPAAPVAPVKAQVEEPVLFAEEEEEEEKPIKKTIFHKKAALVEEEPEEDDLDEDDFDDEDLDLEDEEFEDEEDEEDFDDDDEDFDDEYYDEEFDDDDDEDDNRKGKGSKILFIILILVLLALIAFFGTYIMKKKGLTFSSLFGGKTEQPVIETTPEPIIEDDPITADNMVATIKEDVIDGIEIFEINVKAPTGSTVRIISKAALENDSARIDRDDSITLRVPRVVFLPGEYCETAAVTVNPQLEVTLPDGTARMLAVPAVNIVVSQVEMTLTSPLENPVEAPAGNRPINVSGTVSDHTVTVTVNGASVPVYDGGDFRYDYYPKNEEGETIEVCAKKIDCMSAKEVIEVTPFVIKDMEMAVTNDFKSLRASDGIVTVTGTCPDGALVTGKCADEQITCGNVTVQNGQFSCIVNVPKEGYYEIEFTGTCEGYNDGTTSCIVEAAPTIKSSKYKEKALNLNKKYDSVATAKDVTGVVFTGKIKEIVQTEPYVIFTMEKSDKIVYVANRSEKNKIESDDINAKKEVAGYYCGNYPDTECPYIWGWFIWNA